MSLLTRLQKLHFLVGELALGLHLARHAPDAFTARMLARHIVVRAQNFIEHARAIRKPLRQAGFDTKQYHTAKEAYARFFDEYFQVARDRLGAHIQDFDFGKRIELWNSIEIAKISFFVDGAREIYDGLASLGIPGYITYAAPAELALPALEEALIAFKESSTKNDGSVEFSSDPLAATRPNTISTLNMTPVHSRAGQLALIRRWITIQQDLLNRISDLAGMNRVLKARIITDIVNFADCLITRPIRHGAPQAMDGLDTILKSTGRAPAAIDQFLAVFNFDSGLLAARSIRDQMGAHLEIADGVPLTSLVADLDAFELEAALEFYGHLERLFHKICLEVRYLVMYAADGRRSYGVHANGMAVTPFDNSEPDSTAPVRPAWADLNDDQAYRAQWALWKNGDEHERGAARHYFWNAFLSSQIVETATETAEPGGGSARSHFEKLRKAHQFFRGILASSDDADFDQVIALMSSCRSGAPYMLSDILADYAASAAEGRIVRICYALGELASWPHDRVRHWLGSVVASTVDGNAHLHATLALYKIFLRTEGIQRTNQKRSSGPFDKTIAPLFTGLVGRSRMLFFIAFASQFCHHGLSYCWKPLEEEYRCLQLMIEQEAKVIFTAEQYAGISTLVGQLLGSHDYVGLCVLFATHLKAIGNDDFANMLLSAACSVIIVPAQHDQATRHLAIAFYLQKALTSAYEIADGLATKNPDNVSFKILALQILGEMKSPETPARISALRARYKLTQADQEALAALEAQTVATS